MPRFSLLSSLSLVLLASLGCSDGGDAPDAAVPVDQCLDPADMALVLELTADAGLLDGGAYTEITAILDRCGREDCFSVILGGGDIYGCLDTCMQGTTAGDLSPGCRGCYINNVICARDNCALQCLGSDPAACEACAATYCDPVIAACLGFAIP